MVKFCSNCGKELSENADVCLNCGVAVSKSKTTNTTVNTNAVNSNNDRKKGLPGWAVALIIVGSLLLLLIGILFSFGMFAYNTAKRTLPINEMNDLLEEFKDNVEDAKENAKNFVDEYNENTDIIGEGTVGDTLEIDGMKFTLTKVKEVAVRGNKYLVCFFEIENISSSEKLVSYLNFNLEADNEIDLPEFLIDKIDDMDNLNKNIEPGENVTGYVAFTLEDNYEEVEVSYHRFASNNKITFKIENAKIKESV